MYLVQVAPVTGLSGSTHLLAHLSHDISKKDANFSTEQAMLAGMMFFVFDGGHSLNEIMAVHTAFTASENAAPSEEEVQKIIHEKERKMMANGAPAKSARSIAEMLARQSVSDIKDKVYEEKLRDYTPLNYRYISEIAKHGGSKKNVDLAMSVALEKTTEYFKKNSYYASQNDDVLARL